VKLSTRAMAREYESIRDREVQARTASSPQRKNQHAAEEAADVIAQAEEAARGMFFGLRDIRRELLATLEHYIPWESSLER
jgi:cobalamin-dependent methionine synthase I